MTARAALFPKCSLLPLLLIPSPSNALPSSSFPSDASAWGFGKGLNPLNMTTLIIDFVLGLIILSQAFKLLKLLISKTTTTPSDRFLLPSISALLLSAVSIVAHFGIHAAWVAIARTDFVGPGIPVLTVGFYTWLDHSMYVGDVLVAAGFLCLCLYRAAVINGATQTQSFRMDNVAGESQVQLQQPEPTNGSKSHGRNPEATTAPLAIHPTFTRPLIVKGILDIALLIGTIIPLAFIARANTLLSDPLLANWTPTPGGVSGDGTIVPPALQSATTLFLQSSRAYIGMFAGLSIYFFVSSLLVKTSSDKHGLSDNTVRTLANVVSPFLLIWATIIIIFHVLLYEIAQKDLITGDRATLFTTIRTGVFHFPFYVLGHRLVQMDRAPEPIFDGSGEKRVLGYGGMRERAFNS